ncbi:hypothetical protein LJB76_00980 [Clostridia bacterium OttesenSCG-928-O13]|nr:hypothetical protein [Clostridia bacterium OttesenSCG-928-O13]
MLVFFNQYLLCGLLAGMVIVVEKDEWLSRQTLQAFGLSFMFIISDWIAGAFAGFGDGLLSLITGPLSIITTIISLIVWIPAVVFTIMGWVRAAKGEEARLPILGKWAYKAYGFMAQQPAYQQGGYPPQGGQPYPPQQPMQGQPPVGQPGMPPQGQQMPPPPPPQG